MSITERITTTALLKKIDQDIANGDSPDITRQQYAPPIHPDRISATTRIMCDAIDKIFENTATGVDLRIADLSTKVEEIVRYVDEFKSNMRGAADDLINKIKVAMAHYEDITAKMQDSPFNSVPKLVDKHDGHDVDPNGNRTLARE